MSAAIVRSRDVEAAARPVVSKVVIDLPEPPSANDLFKNTSHAARARAQMQGRKLPGRLKTEAYLSWINAAGWLLNRQRAGRIAGDYTLTITAARSGVDLGNLEKATSDLLQARGVIDNDKRAERIVIEWNDYLPTRTVRITVEAWQA